MDRVFDPESGTFRPYITPTQGGAEDAFSDLLHELLTNPDVADSLRSSESFHEIQLVEMTDEDIDDDVVPVEQLTAEDITDEEYFDLLKRYGPLVNTFPFALEKQALWWKQKGDPDKKLAKKAQDNLKRCHNALAYIGNEKEGIPRTVVAWLRDFVLTALRETDEYELETNPREVITRLFGKKAINQKISDVFEDINKKDKAYGDRVFRLLANMVSAQLLGLEKNTVKQYLSEVDASTIGNYGVYALKKPKK